MVPVSPKTAFAIMCPRTQAFLHYPAASRTFLRGVMRRDRYNCFSAVLCLIPQYLQKLSPGSIRNRLVQPGLPASSVWQILSIFILFFSWSAYHVRYVQIFVENHIGPFQEPICFLVQEVFTLATNPVMSLLQCLEQFVPLLAIPWSTGKPSL